jgi:hypothetical protein
VADTMEGLYQRPAALKFANLISPRGRSHKRAKAGPSRRDSHSNVAASYVASERELE